MLLQFFFMVVLAMQDINLKFDCPTSPNCVSTLTKQKDKEMQALPFKDLKQAKQLLLEIVKKMPRTKIKPTDKNFIHVVFTTKILRFKDDVYFYFDEQAKLIQFKSASRVGHSDLGANKKRMKEITSLYNVEYLNR